MLNYLPSPRLTNLLIFFACAAMMGVGFIFQYVENLEPCPLCITQRFFITLTGLVALTGFAFNPKAWGFKTIAALTTLTTVIGGSFSIRQLWLQSLPADQVPACGPSLSYMLETFPLLEALEVLLRGNGNCAEVVWTLFGVSIPGWTLVAFIALAGISLWQFFRPNSV